MKGYHVNNADQNLM